jgi:hypothetical protein
MESQRQKWICKDTVTYTAVLNKTSSHIYQLVKQVVTVAASAIANGVGSAIMSSDCETLKSGRVWQSLDCSVIRSD